LSQFVNSVASERATLFDPSGNGNNINLGTLGGKDSSAWCINNAGQIVGESDLPLSSYHATLFDSTGRGNNIDLGTMYGGVVSTATAINDLGQIVGSASNPMGNFCAVMFDSTGGGNNIDLNTLINPSSHWVLKNAYGINNDGWIVGLGTYNGFTHAFLLTPEPATILLFGLAGLALRKRN
jgi:probable HAF family extracellular repeat protein